MDNKDDLTQLMEVVERNTIKCKKCGEFVERILAGKFDNKTKRWVDKDGGTFNGKTCPECHRKVVKEFTRNKRAMEKI